MGGSSYLGAGWNRRRYFSCVARYAVCLPRTAACGLEDFSKVGWLTLTILGILTLLATGVDFLATAAGAKQVGASSKAMWGAGLGTFLGIFFGIPGLILGPFIGAAVGEYMSRKNLAQAGRVGVGTWIGILLGVAMKVALIFTILGVFVTAYFV